MLEVHPYVLVFRDSKRVLPSVPKDKDYYAAFGGYPSRFWQAAGVTDTADALLSSGGAPVYAYRFDWDEQGKALGTNISTLIGSAHAIEIPFVTGGFEDSVNDPLGVYFNGGNRAGREALSQAMMSYWAEFAYAGAPGRGRGGDLPAWTPWTDAPGAARLMLLDTPADGGPRMTADAASVDSLRTTVQRSTSTCSGTPS